MRKVLRAIAVCLLFAIAFSGAGALTPTAEAATSYLYEKKTFQTSFGRSMNYRIYLPADYRADRSYPMLLFLHGAGERGDDNEAQLKNVAGTLPADHSELRDCIIVAPQCPKNEKWVDVENWSQCNYSTDSIPQSKAMREVIELLDFLQDQYSVDSDRCYVAGLSMGGYGTWDLLVRCGDRFAAAIPVCGGCDVEKAALLTDIPIRTFHGMKDPTVPYTGTSMMVERIRNLGGSKITFTPYPEGNHLIWDEAFATDGLFTWLLSQKRSDRFPKETESESESEADTGKTPEEGSTGSESGSNSEEASEKSTGSWDSGDGSDSGTKPISKAMAPLITLGAVGVGMVVVGVATAILRKRGKKKNQ